MSLFIVHLIHTLVWHPRCGPCPQNELAGMLNGSALLGGSQQQNGNVTDTDCDRLSNSAMSEMQVRLSVL